jgi:protein O-mannosyl-transferase
MRKNSKPNSVYADLSRSPMVFFVAITLVVLAVFSEVLTADFVMWDDDAIIYKNSNLDRFSQEGVLKAFTDMDTMMRYNPLTLISWSAIHHVFGLDPFGYHLVSWILHGLSSGILFLVLRKVALLSFPPVFEDAIGTGFINVAASLATLCWALHPLRVEPVAWATDLTYCQAFFFLILSTLCYINSADSESNQRRHFGLFFLAVIFYLMSVFSYAIGITYLAVLLVLEIFLLRRNCGIREWESPGAMKLLVKMILFASPAIFVGVMSIVARYRGPRIWAPPVSLSEFGVFDRLAQACYMIVYYIYRPFYPVDLSPVYSTLVSFDPLSLPFLIRVGFVVVLVSAAFCLRKRAPLAVGLVFSYIILLIPVLGVFEHPHYPCDRYSLVTSLFLSVALLFCLIRAQKAFRFWAGAVLVGCIILVLSFLTIRQIKVWNNSETLFTHTIRMLGNDPYREDIYWRLGKYYYEKGKHTEAIETFTKILESKPHKPRAHRYLARIAYDRGDWVQAADHLWNLAILYPYDSQVSFELGGVLKRLKRDREAEYYLDRAVALRRGR